MPIFPLPIQDAPKARLDTPWTAKVSRTLPHPEYPRPQMVRKGWTNLNGPWDYSVGDGAARKILVPFPPESYLSGIMEPVPEGATMTYRRSFVRPKGERVVLHFEAVDWRSEVFVNGQKVGEHEGGYDPFEFDVTAAMKGVGEQSLEVRASDPTDGGVQPRGKQVRKPGGIFYTPSSGIWGTVWVEGVARGAVRSIAVDGTMEGIISADIRLWGPSGGPVTLEVFDGRRRVAAISTGGTDTRPRIRIAQPKLWSPDSPKLYRLVVKVGAGNGGTGDEVESYVGLRTVGLVKDAAGRTRLGLNGEPIFMAGPLDQGFWPDGIYTAPTEEAMRFDLEVTKRLGFNTVRKHVKVEPRTWYAACDRLGLMVWQDMPSGDRSIGPRDADAVRSPESEAIFRREYAAMVGNLKGHPSVVAWVLFNEGWGQFKTAEMSRWAKSQDPTRLLDAVTGWADRGTGDMHDLHSYPGPASPKPEADRAAVLGEFGGLGLPMPGHMWQESGWGYKSYATRAELTGAFVDLLSATHDLIGEPGLSAAIYTQTTDVESELNGLMTYDRRELKVDEERAREAVLALYTPPTVYASVVPTSEELGVSYRYTLEAPSGDWKSSAYDDSAWKRGEGGFGQGQGAGPVRTKWEAPEIWVRREFTLPVDVEGDLSLRIAHDEDVEVWLDGGLIADLPGSTGVYRRVPIAASFLAGGKLGAGRHVLAARCRQTTGGQFLDLGIVRTVAPKRTGKGEFRVGGR